MMAKITKGNSFGGCVKYVMTKKGAQLIGGKDVFYANHKTIAESFEAQSLLNPRLGRKVGHISLNFSAQDKDRIDNALMLKVAGEYMQKMGIVDTQYIVVRHNDREHPHCHIVFNRVDNNGKTISDQNDRLRSVKACRALTEKYGLYIANGKENVNRQQLRDPDKIKYEIHDAIKEALPHCKSWSDLEKQLAKEGISVTFKYKGATGQKEGVIFGKDGQSLTDKRRPTLSFAPRHREQAPVLSACRKFNGSKIDRQFSFSKLDAALNANVQRQESRVSPTRVQTPAPQPDHTQHTEHRHSSHSGGSISGGLFDIIPSSGSGYDENEAEFRRRQRKKKKKQIKPRW